MDIDTAIQQLEEAKHEGVKNIVFAYWTAESFGTEDDEDWEYTADRIELEMDWSVAHDSMEEIKQQLKD
jgi:hypothetical protein